MNKQFKQICKNRIGFPDMQQPSVGKSKPFVCTGFGQTLPPIGTLIPLVPAKQNSGFSLIELIVTLVVAAILASIAIPNFRDFIRNNQISTQTNDLVGDLAFARSEAIKRGSRNVIVCKSQDPTAAVPACDIVAVDPWETGRLIFYDSNGDNQYTAGTDELLRVRGVLEGTNTLRANAGSTVTPNLASYIAFTRSGLTTLASKAAADPPHHFKLCDVRGASKARGIAIQTTGRTKIVRSTSTATASFIENGTAYALTCP
jgi:type IV fimbrial biogenesis protein FimT